MKVSKARPVPTPNSENVAAALDRIDSHSQQINKDHGIVSNEILTLREKLNVITEEYSDYKIDSEKLLADTKANLEKKIEELAGKNESLRSKLMAVVKKIEE